MMECAAKHNCSDDDSNFQTILKMFYNKGLDVTNFDSLKSSYKAKCGMLNMKSSKT